MDRNYPIWHPFTNMKTSSDPLKVVKAKGVYLYLEDGNRIIDGISSWWVNTFGHSNKIIAKAIYKQALELEHVLFAGFTHQPAEDLSHVLLRMLPEFSKVFFSDNGSTSVEVALKMTLQYWFNRGINKRSFIAFEGAYHGDTFGAMSVAERSVFNKPFEPWLKDIFHVPYPTITDAQNHIETEKSTLDKITQLIDSKEDISGLIIEPLIQGAGGMRMCRPEFIRDVTRLCQNRGIIVIFDEVMTGNGRTGTPYAYQQCECSPDIITISKGITGGFLPLGLTLTNERIFNAFYDSDPNKTFYHGHSYTANPLSCAAAVTTLKILEKNQHRINSLVRMQKECAQIYLNDIDSVINLRQCGTIIAFEIMSDEKSNYLNSFAAWFKPKIIEEGVLLRPLGNTVYIMPPYIITKKELEKTYKSLKKLITQRNFK